MLIWAAISDSAEVTTGEKTCLVSFGGKVMKVFDRLDDLTYKEGDS